jgi:hypothetical protein
MDQTKVVKMVLLAMSLNYSLNGSLMTFLMAVLNLEFSIKAAVIF